MKKVLLFLSFLMMPFLVGAKELKNITLQWTDNNENIREILKYDDHYILLGRYSISRYDLSSKKIVNKHNILTDFYKYVEKDNRFYIFDSHQIYVLDEDLNEIGTITSEVLNPSYLEYENGVYRYFGSTSVSGSERYGYLHYYEFNEDFEEIKHQFLKIGNSGYLVGYDSNNVFYFRQYFISSGNEPVRLFKYDGEFSEIDALPEGLTEYNLFPTNEHVVNEIDNLTEREYKAIYAKGEKHHEESDFNIKVQRDGDNYVALFTEKAHYSINEYYDETLMYLDKDFNIKWQVTVPSDGKILSNDCTGMSYSSRLEVYDGNILVATVKEGEHVLTVYNTEGKITNDLSASINDLVNSSSYTPYYLSLDSKGLFAIYLIPYLDCAVKNDEQTNLKLIPTFLANQPNNLINTPVGLVMYFTAEYNITKKVNGEGKVEVNLETAVAGDVIEINATPEAGYVLGEVKVVDALGNIIPVVDGKFVMPSSDVTIEVTFVPLNPNTKAFISYIIVVVGGIAGMLTYLFTQKKKHI